MPYKCAYSVPEPGLFISRLADPRYGPTRPEGWVARGVFYYHRHLSDWLYTIISNYNEYITHINVDVFEYMRHLLYVFLSIPGRRIPHLWPSFMFLLYPYKGVFDPVWGCKDKGCLKCSAYKALRTKFGNFRLYINLTWMGEGIS